MNGELKLEAGPKPLYWLHYLWVMPFGGFFFSIFIMGGAVVLAQQPAWLQPKQPVYHLIAAPKAEDVMAVSGNMMMLDYGTGELDVTLQKERVLEFLSKGEVHAYDNDHEKWFELADTTLPDKIMNNPHLHFDAQGMPRNLENREYINDSIRAEGVLATKQHKIFFWTLWNDRVLFLWDDSGGACLLVLGPDAGTSAPWLKHYFDYPHPERSNFFDGKLPPPKAADVVAFANRTDGMGVRFPVSRERVMRFLTHGTPDRALSFTGSGRLEPLVIRPEKLDSATMQRIGDDGENYAGSIANANGVFSTRNGNIIFWNLSSDLVLWLCDSQHRTCALRLGKAREFSTNFGRISYSVNGRVYESHLPREAVMRGPDWTPPDPPPLSNDKALKIAWRELAKIAREKSMSGWRVAEIEFIPLGYPVCRKWCYKVNFIKPVDPEEKNVMQGLPPAGFRAKATVFVSMDGTPGRIDELVDAED